MAGRRQLGACAVPILLLLLAGAAAPRAARAAPAAAQEENPLPCRCTDVDARSTFITPAEFTCWEQYKFGQCSQDFMQETIIEIPEGYCQITCGRCDCCPTLLQASLAAGLNEFVWAMNLSTASNRSESLEQPGLMVTLLAPNDNAMSDLFNRLGGKPRILSDQGVRDKLGSIMDAHVLPALPESRAVWTAPFMLPGARLQSLGPELAVGPPDPAMGGIVIAAPGSSARIQQRDLYACKGFINVMNWYLLPTPNEF
ncbi:MAG: hypothetical protein J3K34DRAFT_401723 [Monoraphidium minutum]|nr:MAG: hypothetical protein J3K34DRAFT_401723 [Monoraphidium minutum]